jgi:hypothetical protein
MSGDERDLVAGEGVDEGSADTTTEASSDEKASDVYGMRGLGVPDNSEQQAAPELVLTGQDEPSGPGQRQQVGEG